MKDKRTGRIGRKNYPLVFEMIRDGKTALEISNTLDVNRETVGKFARRRGLKIHVRDMSMENHPSWNGGTTLDRTGYELRRVAADGEYGYLIRALRNGDLRGYAPTHRMLMHDKLGRKLAPGEIVHHVDGDKTNNDPDNLSIFASNGDHLRHELTGKVPSWSPEGLARIRENGRRRKSQDEGSLPLPI